MYCFTRLHFDWKRPQEQRALRPSGGARLRSSLVFGLVFALCLCGVLGSHVAFAQSQTQWSMAKIPKIIPFGRAIGVHGDAPKFQFAPAIPAWPSAAWVPAPSTKNISFSEPSRLCGAPKDCFHAADFIFFHTEVSFPQGFSLKSLKIRGWGIDDGMRVTIFNSKHPKGISPKGGFIRLDQIRTTPPNKGAGTTTDLASFLVPTEKNRIVLTIMDDCCAEMALQSAEILVNDRAIGGSNNPPFLTSTPGVKGSVGVAYQYQVAAQDPDGDVLTYRIKSGPPGASIDPKTGALRWTPKAGDAGKKVSFTIEVCDAKGACITQTWEVEVGTDTPKNAPPKIVSSPGTLAKESAVYTYVVIAQDTDPQDVLTYGLLKAPEKASIDTKNGTISWTPPQGSAGKTFPFSVEACDPKKACDTQDWIVEVRSGTSGNLPPKITSTPQNIAYAGLRYIYIINATDPDAGDVLKGALKESPAKAEINGDRLFLTWTPSAADQGKEFAFSITVCDPQKACDQQAWRVSVQAPGTSSRNHHPRFVTRPALSADSGATYKYAFEAIDPNPADIVTYRLLNAPEGAVLAAKERSMTWKVPASARGKSKSFQLLACDQHGACTEQEWQVNISQRCGADSDCAAQHRCDEGVCLPKRGSLPIEQIYTGGACACTTSTPPQPMHLLLLVLCFVVCLRRSH